jgi:hypothetical protein
MFTLSRRLKDVKTKIQDLVTRGMVPKLPSVGRELVRAADLKDLDFIMALVQSL